MFSICVAFEMGLQNIKELCGLLLFDWDMDIPALLQEYPLQTKKRKKKCHIYLAVEIYKKKVCSLIIYLFILLKIKQIIWKHSHNILYLEIYFHTVCTVSETTPIRRSPCLQAQQADIFIHPLVNGKVLPTADTLHNVSCNGTLSDIMLLIVNLYSENLYTPKKGLYWL